MAYEGTDYLALDALLTEDERMVREHTRQFVEQVYRPQVRKHFRAGTFPLEIAPAMGELGLLGTSLKGHGCPGLNNIAYGLAMQELERCDSGLRSFASVQGSLCMYPIWAFGSDAQKQRFLPAMAQGKLVGCFGLTEPDHGSDPGGMKTRAMKDGAHYVLNGGKMWITNGSVADVAIVWAKTGDGPESIRGFLVERGAKGFAAHDIEGKFSLRASVTSELVFDDCRVPEANMLPGVGGLKGPLSCLTQARYGICWGVTGAAMDCYLTARNYALERKQFDRPIASFQLVQAKLVEMLNQITQAQLMNLRLGQLKDAGEMTPVQVSMVKRNNTRSALEAARVARDILGANGIADEYPIVRHMNNLESVYTYEGTFDIHTLTVGRDITGISAFF